MSFDQHNDQFRRSDPHQPEKGETQSLPEQAPLPPSVQNSQNLGDLAQPFQPNMVPTHNPASPSGSFGQPNYSQPPAPYQPPQSYGQPYAGPGGRETGSNLVDLSQPYQPSQQQPSYQPQPNYQPQPGYQQPGGYPQPMQQQYETPKFQQQQQHYDAPKFQQPLHERNQPHVGYPVPMQQYQQTPYGPMPAPIKDPNLAFLLELIGYLGFLGIGHLYAGNIIGGIVLLVFGWAIVGFGFAAFTILTLGIGCLALPLLALVPIASGLWAKNIAQQNNMQGRRF